MAISVDVGVRNTPYGNPGSIGEPLGIWTGRATVTNDASGGSVQLRFTAILPADARRQFVYFIDAAGALTPVAAVGNISVQLQTHWAHPNVALFNPLHVMIVRDSLSDGLTQGPDGILIPEAWQRIPIFWDTQELAGGNSVLVHLQVENNIDGLAYTFSAYGRYYDKAILSNRGFGRLISPVAASQFEG